jgi:hypothetical protein
MALPTELVLYNLKFTPRRAQVHFMLAYWNSMVDRGIVSNLTDGLLLKELIIAGMVCKRLALE